VNKTPEIAKETPLVTGGPRYFVVEEDGTVEDTKTWDATVLTDMRKWLPDKMVVLTQMSLVSILPFRGALQL